MRTVCAMATILWWVGGVRAELPPISYRAWQAAAPEAVHIRVVATTVIARPRTPDGQTQQVVRVVAVVTDVSRTATGVRPGQRVVIDYRRTERERPLCGPSEPPVVKVCESYPAFLRYDPRTGTFGLAAQGRSFDAVGPDERPQE